MLMFFRNVFMFCPTHVDVFGKHQHVFFDAFGKPSGVVHMSVQIHADMLFSGWVLVATLVLNLISALVPTMWILHKQVTEEINHKR